MLDVFLNTLRVGAIIREERTGIISFVLDETYAAMHPRLVLGQQFEERREHRIFRQSTSPGELPTFFANLLPEGALQAMVQAQFSPENATATLAIVGEDLPGAVIVRPMTDVSTYPKNSRCPWQRKGFSTGSVGTTSRGSRSSCSRTATRPISSGPGAISYDAAWTSGPRFVIALSPSIAMRLKST